MMTDERTEIGLEIEAALGGVLAHVRGETALPRRSWTTTPPSGSSPCENA